MFCIVGERIQARIKPLDVIYLHQWFFVRKRLKAVYVMKRYVKCKE